MKTNQTIERFAARNAALLPTHFYNIKADLPVPPDPPLHPGTKEALTPSDLEPVFSKGFIAQEITGERYVPIPEAVREKLAVYRPTPLIYAAGLRKALGTPAHIFYKYEGAGPVGSHKSNTALMQAYLAAQEGIETLVTETGAGQWGSALAQAGSFFGLDIRVFMVRASFRQKPGRRTVMEMFGAKVEESPSPSTQFGRTLYDQDPDHPGSLGIAISEAIEVAVSGKNSKYSLGSVLDAVLMHQTVIGQEADRQMAASGVEPDVVIGCVGGGSNFGGIAFPFIRKNLSENKKTRFVAVEPESCPSITKGEYRYDHGDTAGMTPLLKMHTLGMSFIPAPIHAGGLRYHGMAPLVSHLNRLGLVEARSFNQTEIFDAGTFFFKTEGILPAPESSHAVAAAIDEALAAKASGEEKVILFNLSGHGFLDLAAYAKNGNGAKEK